MKVLRLLWMAGVALSVACSDRLPTQPTASEMQEVTSTGTARADQARRGPRVVAPRPPIGPQYHLLQIGDWGGPQSMGLDNHLLTVASTGATLRSECATGLIDAAILVDAAGHFDVMGTYQVQAGPTGPPLAARFVGFVQGEKLTLSVSVTETGHVLGPFTLNFGRSPKIGYCPIV